MASTDSYLRCILWRDSSLDELRTYKLETVTYGTKLKGSFYTEWQEICPSFSHIQRPGFPQLAVTFGTLVEIHGLELTGDEDLLRCAKSRVSSLKTLTVSMLELAEAKLLVRMMAEVFRLGAYKGKYVSWCD